MNPTQKHQGRGRSLFPDCQLPGTGEASAREEFPFEGSQGLVLSIIAAVFLCMLLSLSGCGLPEGETPTGAVVGRADRYDYSPSVIQTGQVQDFWWCGQAPNPANPAQDTDTILHESIDLTTGKHVGPAVVLAETAGAWDSAYVCNPQVVQGTFQNPLGDGQIYTYALYYVGTSTEQYTNNGIGVAFSKDGINWKKYPAPVIPSHSLLGYGPAQPVPFNSDGKQAIWVFYEDDSPPLGVDHHTQATSSDGIHFTDTGTLTTNGVNIPPQLASWADMAYNPADGYWYAVFNLPSRDAATTADIQERGSFGFQVYRIPRNDLLIGKTGWQQLKTVDTNLTGYEDLFLPGFLRDPYGNLYQDGSGTMQVFPSFSNELVAWNATTLAAANADDTSLWDISRYTWSPANSLVYELKRYNNDSAHLVTTGWVDSNGHFSLEKTLGQVYQYPQQGATVALYGCKAGAMDSFVSLDATCEGKRVLGINGYLYAQPVAGLALLPIYRCDTGHDHFVSSDPSCEGSITEQFLGYILPA